MRALQFLGVCYYFFLAILMSRSWAALSVSRGCRNVPGVGDMTDTINNELFVRSVQMAQYARWTLEDFIYRPQDMTEANRRRINELLAVAALPSRNERFRRALNGIIDALRRISSVTSTASRRDFFDRIILCDTDEVNFPKNTTNADGSPIMLNGEPSWQYYCRVCNPPHYTAVGARLCAEGVFGITELGRYGNFLAICGPTFAFEPQYFPDDRANRLQNFTALEYPRNHIEYWLKGRVGTFIHEMHHALVPGSDDIELEIKEDHEPDVLKAYGYHGVTRLSREVRYEGRSSANLYENAETIAFIAIALWLGGSMWHDGFAES